MPFEIGIIGAGRVAGLHAEAAAKAGLRVGAVCDVDEARARALAEQCPGAAVTTSRDELLSRPEIAAVAVATPNVYHKETAIAALRAGKDVLLEKPMAMSPAECDEIIETIRQTGRLLQLGFVCRCAPAAVAVRELLAAGRLGRIYHAKASLCRQRGIPGLGRWFTTKSMSGGGVLMDLGVHLLDLVLYLTGFPRATQASAICTSNFGAPLDRYVFEEMWAGPPNLGGVFDVEDGVTALIRFETGLSMELNVTWAVDLPEDVLRTGFVLLGDQGGCFFNVWRNQLTVTTERQGALVHQEPALPEGDAWAAAWREQYVRFARAVTERVAPDASAENGRAVQTLIDAVYRSGREGREVDVG
ncbi:MAG: Gfo/Idh/MocA family protein [Planctomycetota bacterium]|jgi:predicted dehydrogenase